MIVMKCWLRCIEKRTIILSVKTTCVRQLYVNGDRSDACVVCTTKLLQEQGWKAFLKTQFLQNSVPPREER